MTKEGLMWECECGQIEYGTNPPEECNTCSAIATFTKVPDDLIEKKEADSILSNKRNDD